MKDIYVVLGMARGGTSAIARALAAIGINLGEKLTKADAVWNPTGFWEDSEIVNNVNRRLLSMIGEPWMSTRLVEPAKLQGAQLAELEADTLALLKKRMAHNVRWGFKDPRTVKVLAFWQSIFSKLELNENYIIALRNPLSSARSYSHLSGERLESSLLFWLMHMVAAVEGTHDKHRVIVNYDAILQQPQQQLERLAKSCQLAVSQQEIDVYANQFINQKLYRHSATEAELANNAAIAAIPLCAKVYFLLAKVARDELSITSAEFSDAWQAIMVEFNVQYPLYLYVDTVLQRTRALDKRIYKINRSLPWRLMFPLRLVDTLIRSMRHRSREREVVL